MRRPFGRSKPGGKDQPAADDAAQRRMSDWTLPTIPDEWLPPEVLASRPPAADPKRDAAPPDWVPRNLPEPVAEAAPRRRRSGEHPVPAASDQGAVSELKRERGELLREREELRAELEATRAELEAARGPEPSAAAREGELVDMNTATIEELMGLPSVGRRAAQQIVEFRELNGPFRSLEDVCRVEGFHAERLKRFADRVTV